ncbi:MAG: hypothetical protein JXA57_14165 [Armatimonadetes bacterium]|nr:hypothetical protein [Armatimonadota bacterium]
MWENTSKKGQKYLTAEIGGQRYNIWDEPLFAMARAGAEVEYDARQSGKYLNIVSINPADGSGSADAPEEPHGFREPEYRSRAIRRMSCLRAASTLAASLDLSDAGDPVEFTVGVARKFEDYIREEPRAEQQHPATGEKKGSDSEAATGKPSGSG